MFIKKYVVNDMGEAMGKIRSDLGPDALIVSSRLMREKGVKGMLGKKKLEVVAAYEPNPNTLQNALLGNTQYAKPKQPQPKIAPQPEMPAEKIDKLSERLEDLTSVVQELSGKQGKEIDLSGARAKKLFERFVEQDVWEDIARDVLSQAIQISKVTSDPYDVIVENLLVQKMGTSQLKHVEGKQTTMLLMGPTGVGKTTTLVKLAGKYMLQQGMSVGIINTDTYRVAANEQLRTYADIMTIPMVTVYKPEEMADARRQLSDCQIILVDTAGKSSYDQGYREDMREFIEQGGVDEVLLLISAPTGYRCVKETVANYSFTKDYKLIVTKTDEVRTSGNILNIASLANKPVIYLTTGQSVPEDIEPADARLIANYMIGRR